MKRSLIRRLMGCLGVWLVMSVFSLLAGESTRRPQASVLGVTGRVEFRPAGSDVWYAITTNQVLYGGDSMRTGERSRATLLLLGDRSVLPVRESSSLQLLDRPEGVVVQLLRGILSFFHRDEPGRVEVGGGGINASVRGTDFAFEVREDQSVRLTLYDGEVELTGQTGDRLTLHSGEVAEARAGESLRKTAVLSASDWSAVQWSLYYPAILDPAELGGWTPPAVELQASWELYRRGNLPKALSAYPAARVPATPEERVYLAALLLSVGSVGEAEVLLGEVGEGEPATHLARAHRRLIATVKRGPSVAPGDEVSPTELLASSYALQSEARLADARDRARAATERSPGFGFAWVRQAELEFSLGNVRAANSALERGRELTPENAEAHALQGFLDAALNRLSEAEAAFETALGLDASLGNAWLGRGLCRIRRGDLAGGRADLLVAAAIEPQRAILRSYLGKALADSQAFRTPSLDEKGRHELELARRLDPGDPTPWLYSALLNQRENRVNDAVSDLERSMELNDNRALYRSALGLDQDRAVRGANLAALYQDAGMKIVGVHAATRAVEDDYASFSAHQFLADSYNALRDQDQVNLRYESAWFSEYLVANLLAPVGAGRLSTTLAPNEYSRLFERDGLGLAGRTDYWSNGDWQQSASQFGTLGNLGYAVDVFYRSDNGQRINDDAEQVTVSVQAKQQIGLDDSVFLQAIYYDAEFGDVAPYYDPASANPEARSHDRQEPQLIAGWHHAWAPGSDTLFLVARLQDRYTLSDPYYPQPLLFRNPGGSAAGFAGVPTALDYTSEFSAWSLEGQHLWRHEAHTVVAGIRYQTGTFDTDSELGSASYAGNGLPALAQDIEADLGRFSAYLYEHWQVLDWLRLSVGVSYDWVRQPLNFRVPPLSAGEDELDQVSPKLGLTLTPWAGGTVRAAYTRSMGGVSFDQSFRLEPTQVAGFNQAFRGLIPESVAGSVGGQEFETWGASLEQRFPSRTYLTLAVERVGSEADRAIGTRELAFGAAPSTGFTMQALDFEERSLLITANQLVGREVSFGAAYRMSQATLDTAWSEFPSAAQDLESVLHQLDLEARFTHPSGFFSVAEGIWTRQSNHGYTPDRPGDDFWHLNLHAGWRFDRRNFEIAAGILNVTDQDYRLNPLNYYREPYRDRTFTMSVRFDL